MRDVQDMIGKQVEVIANGVNYSGVLVEVSEEDVHLKTRMQWISLPAESVSTIKLAGAVEVEPEREGQAEPAEEEASS